MRYVLVIGLFMFAVTVAVGDETPIPQDSAQMEKRFRDRLEWNRQSLGAAYEKVGTKSQAWDEPAREGLEMAARMFSQQFDPIIVPLDIHGPMKKAVDAGCNDPLVLYLYFRSSVGKFYPGQNEYNGRAEAAVKALKGSNYSPYRTATALRYATELKAAKKNLTPEERLAVEGGLDAVLDFIPKSSEHDARTEDWDDGWYGTINAVIAAHRQLGGDYKAAFDRVDARLAKFAGIEALRLTIKGNFQLKWGWEARTEAFAAALSDEQVRTFEARVQAARATLLEAWKAKTDQPRLATLMLEVEKSIGGGDREAMETWFERAMKANGNDQDACWTKLDWLDPKWYGGDTTEPMLAFGKACAATNNWHTGITLLAADAHLRHAARLSSAESKQYLKSPEVWIEIQRVYDEYLEHYPGDDIQRSKYAMLCYAANHLSQAHDQFQAVGERLTRWPSFPNYTIQAMTDARDYTARIIAENRRLGTAPSPKGDGPPRRSR